MYKTKTPISDKTNEVNGGTRSTTLQNDIALAAYYRAMARGFAPGREIEDWLEAEQDIDLQNWLKAQQALDNEYLNIS